MYYKILKNIKIKIIVSIIAFLVWFFVKTEHNYKYSLAIPLRIVNLGYDRIVEKNSCEEVEITSWGNGRSLFSLMLRKDLYYNLDVSKIHNKTNLQLEKKNIRSLQKNDIEILEIVQPDSIEIIISDLLFKKIPVFANIDIAIVPGYSIVGNVKVIPDSVVVQGTETRINEITAITTEEKKFTNIKRDLEKSVKLNLPSQKNIKIFNEEVTIYADVQKLMEKPLTEIPVKVINCPKKLKINVIPSTLSLVLEGGTDLLLNISQKDIQAYIDYSKVYKSKDKLHLAYIIPPDNVRYRDVKPKRFKLIIEKIR